MDDSSFQNLVDTIIAKADIVNIISQYVKLEKKGNNYIGLCPFHEDKNPSMSVSPTKKIYKCFSCNAGGNVVKFVQNYKNISFIEALREVGDTVGIKVETTKKESFDNVNKKYYNIMKDASDFYSFYLKNTKEGKQALEYLHNRQIDDNIIDKFNIGLASSDDNDLYLTMIDSEFNHLPVDMIDVGLIRSGANNYYDTFKKRIMFPIEDLDGRVVAFSGRKYLKDDPDSKYMNSSETIIFKKGQILYNYHNAFEVIKKSRTVYLFEGFMDVIASYRANVLNSVASMGTALTNDQIKAMKKIADTIVVCYDGDEAGIVATKRAIKMILANGINVKVVSMPEGIDPDEYINKYGNEALNDYLLNKTITGLDFALNLEKKNLNINDISSIEHFKDEMFKHINMYHSSVLAEKYLTTIANELNISYESLKDDYNGFSKNNIDNKEYPIYNNDLSEAYIPEFEQTVIKRKVLPTPEKYLNAEKDLLRIAYNHIDKAPEIVKKLDNNSIDMKNYELLLKLENIYIFNRGIDQEGINKKLTQDELDLISAILNAEIEPLITEIDVLVETVKNYQYDESVDHIITKDRLENDDLEKMIEYKKKIVKIKYKKE